VSAIPGVKVEPVTLFPDDRGYFLEVVRLSSPPTAQISATLSYPGTIKAFHVHEKQTDVWTPVAGMFQVVLVDMRPGGERRVETIFAGDLKPLQITIPPGVGHGYKVVGARPGVLVYYTDRFYDPSDEGRIPYNDPSINYDWSTQHK
jgi:dTDP-4-dehydrorhamnose 3,5-epimerase